MALRDDVFKATAATEIRNVFRAVPRSGKKSLELKIKREALDKPVFREPGRAADKHRTSSTKALRTSTWLRQLKRLGQKAGLQQTLTQYVFWRGLVNAVNHKAPAETRDQIFDHFSNAVGFYLDKDIRFDTAAALLDRLLNKIVQNMARLLTLTVDPIAPYELSGDISQKIMNSNTVVKLSNRSKALTRKIKDKYGLVKKAPGNDPLVVKKASVDAALYQEKSTRRNKLKKKARKRHFRNADTDDIEAQFADTKAATNSKPSGGREKPLEYNIPERGMIVRLICEPDSGFEACEMHERRMQAIEARVALCGRQESRHLRKPKSAPKDEFEDKPLPTRTVKDPFPMICKPKQCPFCLGKGSWSYQQRTFEYCDGVRSVCLGAGR